MPKRKSVCHPPKSAETADGLCDACYRKRRYHTDSEYRKRHLARAKPRRKRRYAATKDESWALEIQRKYGITKSEYEWHLARQLGGCAVCMTKPANRRLAVDHNHLTGSVRGLLCDSCNRGIGLLHDDPIRLRAAAIYVAQSGSQPVGCCSRLGDT